MRSVAREFHTNARMVQRWVARAGTKRLDRVNWSDRPSGAPRPVNRTSIETESIVLRLRRELTTVSDLGEFGADAIHATMLERELAPVPSVRTIGRTSAPHWTFVRIQPAPSSSSGAPTKWAPRQCSAIASRWPLTGFIDWFAAKSISPLGASASSPYDGTNRPLNHC